MISLLPLSPSHKRDAEVISCFFPKRQKKLDNWNINYTVHLAQNGTFSRYFWQVLWQQVDKRDQRIVEEHRQVTKASDFGMYSSRTMYSIKFASVKYGFNSTFFPEFNDKITSTAFATSVISKTEQMWVFQKILLHTMWEVTTSKAVKQVK